MPENYKEQILQILRTHNIQFWTSGNNVSVGISVNVNCPYCDDPSNHCGVFYETMLFHCWRCNKAGHFSTLLIKLLGIPEEQARALTDSPTDFKRDTVEQIEDIFDEGKEEPEEVVEEAWPPPCMEFVTADTNVPLLNQYMAGRPKRNGKVGRPISRETLLLAYCGFCQAGPYMNRLIIPISCLPEGVVGFQAADMTGRARLKYRTSKGRARNYLYGYDHIGSDVHMVITEGILDCWRVYNYAVATFGTAITDHQRQLILNKRPKKITWCWDGDAYWKAQREASYFLPFVDDVRVACLPDGEDPDSLGHEEVWKFIENADPVL